MKADDIGSVIFQETYNRDGAVRSISVTEVAPVTVVGLAFLDAVITGGPLGCRVEGDLFILDLANGKWIYRLGEYNPTHRGITARLINGEPLRKAT